MPIETIKIEQDRILVVEGKEETLFFSALITQLGLHGIQILPVGGKTNLRPNLKALRNAAGFDRVISLGLVRDADNDPVAAFQSVRSALTAVNLNAPTQVGTPSGANPKVTVMIIPDGNTRGMLEDVCLNSVADRPAVTCVNQYFQCVLERVGTVPALMSKAKVHAFLAAQIEPGKRLGEAAQAGYWPLGNPAFNPISQFLRSI